jgi:quercetin dioxygenase-like cupin family protein
MGGTALNTQQSTRNKGRFAMSRSGRTLSRSLFAVAGIAALAGSFSLGVVVAQQPLPATKATQVRKQAIPEFPGHEVRMTTLDIPPGGGSAPHRHPTTHTFGYVLEGTYRIKLDDGPERVLTKGDTFYEAPNQLHAVSRNASNTEPAKVLVVGIGEIGKPGTVPERP